MQVREVQLRQRIEPELASLAIPGLGQLLQGRLIRATLWFLLAFALWAWVLAPDELHTEVILVIPLGLGLHIASARAAFLAANSTEPNRPENQWNAIPLFQYMKVLGGVLLTVAAFHFLIAGAELLRKLIDASVTWGGGFFSFPMTSRIGGLVERSVIMVAVGVIGFALYQLGNLWQMHAAKQTHEQLLLQEAHARGGSLTVPEAAAILRLSLEEAHELMEQMAQRRWIGVSIAENGQKVYQFFASW